MTDAPGLQWVQSASEATAYTRLGALSGKTLAQAIAYCDVTPPWSQMRRCNLLDNGAVSAFYNGGAGCYSDTDVATRGQVMVDIECFDYYTDFSTPGTYIWYIQPHGADMTVGGSAVTWNTHPAFIRNGVTKDRIFLSAYEAYLNGTKLESKAGVQPTASQTIAQFRAAAQARVGGVANKWEQQDYLTTCAVQLLYLLEYGGFNSQTLLSAGITNAHNDGDHNQASNTGHTTTLGNASGQVLHTFDHVPDSGATTGYAMSYRGIENLYGNLYKFVDGLHIDANYTPFIADHGFNDIFPSNTPYVASTATPLIDADGFVTDIKVDATYDYGFLPSAVGGSAATKLCDYYYCMAGNKIAAYGGNWAYINFAGAFYWHFAFTVAASFVSIGARLEYIG